METAIIAGLVAAVAILIVVLAQRYIARKLRISRETPPLRDSKLKERKEVVSTFKHLEDQTAKLRTKSWIILEKIKRQKHGNFSSIVLDEFKNDLDAFGKATNALIDQEKKFLDFLVSGKNEMPQERNEHLWGLHNECTKKSHEVTEKCRLLLKIPDEKKKEEYLELCKSLEDSIEALLDSLDLCNDAISKAAHKQM